MHNGFIFVLKSLLEERSSSNIQIRQGRSKSKGQKAKVNIHQLCTLILSLACENNFCWEGPTLTCKRPPAYEANGEAHYILIDFIPFLSSKQIRLACVCRKNISLIIKWSREHENVRKINSKYLNLVVSTWSHHVLDLKC